MSRPSLSLRLLGLTLLCGLATTLGSVAGTGCSTPLPGNDVCQDVGYAISNKLFECNGDVDEANDAYERFQATHGCKISDLPTEEEVLEGRIAEPPYATRSGGATNAARPFSGSAASRRGRCRATTIRSSRRAPTAA